MSNKDWRRLNREDIKKIYAIISQVRKLGYEIKEDTFSDGLGDKLLLAADHIKSLCDKPLAELLSQELWKEIEG